MTVTAAFLHPHSWERRSPERGAAEWLIARGGKVAWITAPISPWNRNNPPELMRRWKQERGLGRWRTQRLFTLTPRTLLPLLARWPFDCNAAYNGSEYFTRPRAGEILRENGLDRVDLLVLSHFEMVHLVRHVRPARFVVHFTKPSKRQPKTVERMREHVLADADLVIAEDEVLAAEARRHTQSVECMNGDAERFRSLLFEGVPNGD